MFHSNFFVIGPVSKSFNKGTVIFYRFRPKVLERQVSSPVDTFSLKSLSNGIYIYKIESEAFSKSGKS
jgi:hypothetical protein